MTAVGRVMQRGPAIVIDLVGLGAMCQQLGGNLGVPAGSRRMQCSHAVPRCVAKKSPVGQVLSNPVNVSLISGIEERRHGRCVRQGAIRCDSK